MSLSSTVSGGIATLVLDDGGVNRLTREVLRALRLAISELPSSVRLLCLRSGQRGIFAAGADMEEMSSFSAMDALAFSREGQTLMEAFGSAPCATVVVVDGECRGGALDLIMSFDFRVATRGSRFAHPGARLGIVTGFGGTVRIPAAVGSRRARELFLQGNVIDGESAGAMGLIDLVVDSVNDPALESWMTGLVQRRREIISARALVRAASAVDAAQLDLLSRRVWALEGLR